MLHLRIHRQPDFPMPLPWEMLLLENVRNHEMNPDLAVPENATNVDGVYDKNPKISGAKKIDTVTVEELSMILAGSGTRAGEYKLFDPVAIRVVGRSKIPTVIFNGNDPMNFRQVMKGARIGTRIVH